jgi:hypothetical protein
MQIQMVVLYRGVTGNSKTNGPPLSLDVLSTAARPQITRDDLQWPRQSIKTLKQGMERR